MKGTDPMKDYSNVARAVFGRPWMIQPEMLQTIAAIVSQRLAGLALTDEEIAARVQAGTAAAGPRNAPTGSGPVGIIPIYGVIVPRSSLMTEMSGGTSVQSIRERFRAALSDDTVASILLDVDSPGGYVDGVEELATEIRAARGKKPIVAIADYQAASAAYYIASQADELVASPSAMVGWIGCVTVHKEYSRMDDAAGVTTTIFRSPEGKFGANEYEPLSEKARTEMERQIQDYAGQFEQGVARGRGVSVATVRSDFGQGGGMTAARAKAAGLVDSVETFDEVVKRMAAGRVQFPRGRGTGAVDTGMVEIEPGRFVAREDVEDAPHFQDLTKAAIDGELAKMAAEEVAEPEPEPALDLVVARAKARAR